MASRVKKSLIRILRALWSIDEPFPDVFLKLFVCQNFSYDVLCIRNMGVTVHIFALKRILGVPLHVP